MTCDTGGVEGDGYSAEEENRYNSVFVESQSCHNSCTSVAPECISPSGVPPVTFSPFGVPPVTCDSGGMRGVVARVFGLSKTIG